MYPAQLTASSCLGRKKFSELKPSIICLESDRLLESSHRLIKQALRKGKTGRGFIFELIKLDEAFIRSDVQVVRTIGACKAALLATSSLIYAYSRLQNSHYLTISHHSQSHLVGHSCRLTVFFVLFLVFLLKPWIGSVVSNSSVDLVNTYDEMRTLMTINSA